MPPNCLSEILPSTGSFLSNCREQMKRQKAERRRTTGRRNYSRVVLEAFDSSVTIHLWANLCLNGKLAENITIYVNNSFSLNTEKNHKKRLNWQKNINVCIQKGCNEYLNIQIFEYKLLAFCWFAIFINLVKIHFRQKTLGLTFAFVGFVNKIGSEWRSLLTVAFFPPMAS